MDGESNNLAEDPGLPQAMAFTVTFNTGRVVDNKFVKRHVRNLSLPIQKSTSNVSPPEVNGKIISNHSEGYFSSDPEDDPGKLLNTNNVNSPEGCQESSGGSEEGNGNDEEDTDENVSETGTYTIERESPGVVSARLNIDQVFGVQNSEEVITSRDSPHWVAEWATNAVSQNERKTTPPHRPLRPASAPRQLHGTSKIPSPVVTRARLGGRLTRPASDSAKPKQDETGDEAEKHLKTTERVMEALAARLSLDSEPDDSRQGGRSTDSSDGGRPPPTPPPVARATLLSRRGRVEAKVETKSTVVRREESAQAAVFKKPLPVKTAATRTPTTPVLSRTDTGRFSMRCTNPKLKSNQILVQAQQTNDAAKSPGVLVKKKTGGGGGGGRSNSTLSSKEVEFQNWKRRKSYDPMKAAAEGKKTKDTRKSTGAVPAQPHPTPTHHPASVSGSSGPSTGGTSVLRSASFHGTRQLQAAAATSSSEDDNPPEEHWPPVQAPRSSRETTPLGSRVSLCSNNSYSPQPGRHKLEGVDNLVVAAVSNLSTKLKLGGSTLLRKLRCLYDEDSVKGRQLTAEIEALEASSGSSSPHRSPSKELASTLRNLKRLESMFKVMDEVMFDDIEYE